MTPYFRLKNTLKKTNSRLTDIEECISDLEDRIREIIQSEQQTDKGKIKKKVT